eukprot:g28148.t1
MANEFRAKELTGVLWAFAGASWSERTLTGAEPAFLRHAEHFRPAELATLAAAWARLGQMDSSSWAYRACLQRTTGAGRDAWSRLSADEVVATVWALAQAKKHGVEEMLDEAGALDAAATACVGLARAGRFTAGQSCSALAALARLAGTSGRSGRSGEVPLREEFLKDSLPKFMEFFTKKLEKTGTFFCGDQPTIADLQILAQLRYFTKGVADHVPRHPEVFQLIDQLGVRVRDRDFTPGSLVEALAAMATVNAQNEDVANLASATFVTGPRAGEHCRALTTTQVSRLALASGRCALRSVTWASLHEAARRMSDLRGALQPFELAHLTFGAALSTLLDRPCPPVGQRDGWWKTPWSALTLVILRHRQELWATIYRFYRNMVGLESTIPPEGVLAASGCKKLQSEKL